VFKEAVMDDFADSYLRGETPIPCVRCNQSVKFRDLYKVAKDLGADALATGHYIRSRQNGVHRALHRPVDSDRDQSYFLFATTQEQIDYLRFPLGGMSKPDVRKIAEDLELVVAAKQDSQDICFVPQGKYSDVIAKLRPNAIQSGAIMHLDGRVLGEHQGILHYTIGQRRGIGVATGEPLYVVHLDADKARVIVGPREALETHRIILRDMNWLGDEALENIPSEGLELFAKVRSTREPKPAVIHYDDGKVSVELTDGESGIAPGQACVLYSDDGNDARILGGGFIARSERGATAEAMLQKLANFEAVAV
jgi:tRNA-specific 2-thiouridylase